MAFLKNYVSQIGLATENEAKMGLYLLFLDRFTKRIADSGVRAFEHRTADIGSNSPEELKEYSYTLAAQCANRVFGDKASAEKWQMFIDANSAQIGEECKCLSSDEYLCQILTKAAYNAAYGRYTKAGGSIGVLSNNYLSFIRTLGRGSSYDDFAIKKFQKINELDCEILSPILSIGKLGLFRGLPHNPNEKQYYADVHNWAISVGVKFK
ncbi:MAG: hypothetical protein ABSC48_16480 [Terracidiphilus sp.]